ncbi:MAG: hypothetical protein V3U11_10060, partial [Planctomycetota bacterium]
DWIARTAGRPIGALWRRFWWVFVGLGLILLVVVVGFLEPVLGAFGRGLQMLLDLTETLGQSTTGRLVLVLLGVAITGLLLWWILRGRLRRLWGRMDLGRHLKAVASLLGDDRSRARDQFAKVARSRRPAPKEYAHLTADANLKLARLALTEGNADEALGHLARIRQQKLPKELERSLLQLRAEASLQQGELLPEALEKELRTGLKKFSNDYRLHKLMREALLERGALEEVATIQEQAANLAPPAEQATARHQLLEDLLAAGEAALTAGDFDNARRHVKRAQSTEAEAPGPGVLLGKILLAQGDPRAAIRQWGKTRSPEGLDEVAQLLRDKPGVMEPRELLECCPMQGTLLIVAREYALSGETRKAERAARKAARTLGPSPTVAAVLTEVLELIGKNEDASALCEQAILRLVSPGEATS